VKINIGYCFATPVDSTGTVRIVGFYLDPGTPCPLPVTDDAIEVEVFFVC
jgi:hypothetical protein